MLIYSPTLSPRLSYIIALIGRAVSNDTWTLTTDAGVYDSHQGPRINYSNERRVNDLYYIVPHGLITESGIHQQDTTVFTTSTYPVLFATNGDLPFDIFSASFFLISRYEEYLPHQKDMYGRYAHQNSTAFREQFLHRPLVNIWLADFADQLTARVPGFAKKERSYRYLPTYDIDIAWSYSSKGIMRNMLGSIRQFFKLDFAGLLERWRVLAYDLPDPFDAYEWLDETHKALHLHPLYFFLVAGERGKYDFNISPTRSQLRTLIKGHSLRYEVGVHPSWKSGDVPAYILYEKNLIEAVTGKPVTHSRQHYIRMDLPATYRQLLEAGIQDDYSMGYGSINGFRASYTDTYPWYDLQQEEETLLQIHPFCYMEANSFYEQHSTAQQALDEMRQYRAEVKAVGGQFITIWHNHFLGSQKGFAEWKKVYEEFLKENG